jgi:predicted transcriptional regulator
MTAKSDFTEDEWDLVVGGPPTAGMMVITAQRGGTFRETYSIAKSYSETRKNHGASELLDEIVSAKPEIDHKRYHTYDELKQHTLQKLRDAVALLDGKATADEVEAYKHFTVALAERVAKAHHERGNEDNVSAAERAAIDEIAATLGVSAS